MQGTGQVTLGSKVINISPIPPLPTLLCVTDIGYTGLLSLSCLHTFWHAIYIYAVSLGLQIEQLNVKLTLRH